MTSSGVLTTAKSFCLMAFRKYYEHYSRYYPILASMPVTHIQRFLKLWLLRAVA